MKKPFPQLSPRGTALLKKVEGVVPYVYDDAVYPTRRWVRGAAVIGNLTAGVGHLLTQSEIAKFVGKDISDAQINQWLDDDTDTAEKAVYNLVKVPLSATQRDALILFVFNIGVGAFADSTLLKKLNKGDYSAVPSELAKWNKTTKTIGFKRVKVKSDGLVKRRAHEAALWASGVVPSSDSFDPADVGTGTAIAEPEAPPAITLESVATGATIINTIFSSVTDGPLSWVIAGAAAVSFGVLAYWFITKRLFPK